MMLTLDHKYLALVKEILMKHIPDKTVWVYGSRIKDSAHEGSDLDLVIMNDISNEQISSLRSAFSESNLPILVDLMSWSEIPNEFRNEIEETHEVLQEDKP
jgi:predicted nucleotidyltransferase